MGCPLLKLKLWLGYGLNEPVFYSRQGQEFFSSPKSPNRHWGPPNLLWVPGFFPRVKQLGCEGDHSSPSSAEVES